MGLLSDLGSMLNGQDGQRMAAGQGQFQDPSSPDMQTMQTMVDRADPGQLQQIFSHVAQRMNPQEYGQHMAAGPQSPLSGIGGGGLKTIAATLMQHLSGSGIAGNLLSKIPGLQTTDPQQMDQNRWRGTRSRTTPTFSAGPRHRSDRITRICCTGSSGRRGSRSVRRRWRHIL